MNDVAWFKHILFKLICNDVAYLLRINGVNNIMYVENRSKFCVRIIPANDIARHLWVIEVTKL